MLVNLEAVLDEQQLAVARQLLEHERFREGELSAGEQARRNKHNLESSGSEKLNNLVMGALIRHPVYLNAGLPARVAAPFYSLYKDGMGYGYHIDDPVMGERERYRSDIAITLFLNSPDEYAGGELEIELPFGTQLIKGKAGDGVMYPASSRHRVRTVTAGERLVAVTWMQSLVAGAEQRALLFELFKARQALLQDRPEDTASQQVDHAYVNLVRMWSQP